VASRHLPVTSVRFSTGLKIARATGRLGAEWTRFFLLDPVAASRYLPADLTTR
jgi:hypothetical protein